MTSTLLDQYVARLQNLPPIDLQAITADGKVVPWYKVDGDIIKDIVINEDTLAIQVQTIASQIAHWGRLASQAKRVWEIEERFYRQWRDKQVLSLVTPPADDKGWKKPTESVIEATYRTHPEYEVYYSRIEKAEESYNGAMAYLEGFKAKKDMLKASVFRQNEQSQPRLSV